MKKIDVLICGAGISGLYCAKKILEDAVQSGRGTTVAIIESTNRIGGRIRTRRFPQFPDTPLELGPMRYLETHHLVSSLVEEYALETQSFTSNEDKMYFLRGEKLVASNGFSSQAEYAVDEGEKGKSPAQLLEYAIDKVIPKEVWQYIRSDNIDCSMAGQSNWLDKIKLDMGLRDFLLSVISQEAFDFIKDGSGYDSSFENWNAREAVCHIIKDFLLEPDSFMLTNGFEALSQALEADIRALGGEFYLNTRLQAFNADESSYVESVRCQIVDCDNTLSEISARKLILAVPQKSLLTIARNSPVFSSPQIIDLLQTVSPQPAVKIFLSYEKAWWKALPDQYETVTTDIPLSKVYYRLRESPSEKQAGGVLLAVYADMAKFDFWNKFITDNHNEEVCAPVEMQQTITRMLSEVHGFDVPEPTSSKVIRWSSDYSGDAYHAWNPGIDCSKVMQQVSNPIVDVPVYICGEAYSKYQCWMEGALSSAEFILNNYFSEVSDSWVQSEDLHSLNGAVSSL